MWSTYGTPASSSTESRRYRSPIERGATTGGGGWMSVSGFAIVVGGRGLLRAVQSSAKLRGRLVAFAGGCAGPAAVAPAAAGVGLRGLSNNSRAAVATTSVSGPIA